MSGLIFINFYYFSLGNMEIALGFFKDYFIKQYWKD